MADDYVNLFNKIMICDNIDTSIFCQVAGI